MITHEQIFRKVIHLVTLIVLYVLLLGIIVGMFNVFQNIGYVWLTKGGFGQVVYSVLTIFVLIDFFKAFSDYHVHERIRLTYVSDATIMIVLREVTVLIYSHEFESDLLLVFSVLLLVLGIIRAIAVKFPPSESSYSISPIKEKNIEEE
ncbi:phosphate-starvation-inducible PsiE family protein [Methanolobus mangrovi]|uniref:Phosphate-starvation-inducible PsiE family protein n=1 Tax=Methanolobus mangrovi TaxID=3072977 RepID=A0AA51UEN7_9EURY|nr:phosphate-starvation-inducible PsiE family protein [Methanolobus mangrovi]WMW21748.1 phosphate-starvation-inducible PsiE family protein [Methanolobus mangrovi]